MASISSATGTARISQNLRHQEKASFAKTLRNTVGMLDSLFGYRFPYMMCMHNAPVNGEDTSEYYHFHVEFFPPMRSETKIKYNASSETGAWAHCNPTCPEDTAEELRQAYRRFLEKKITDTRSRGHAGGHAPPA